MIDTIRCKVGGEWKGRLPGWKEEVREGITAEADGEERERRHRWLQHEATGLRVMGDLEQPAFVECSLPRQLFSHNGRLIATPEQLSEAWGRAEKLVASVVDGAPGCLTRLDLCWQYRGNPAAWVQGLGSSRHPRIRREPCQWFGQSVTWQGKEQVLRCYDKALEVFSVPGDVVRLEAQLRGKALQEAVGKVQVVELDWGACWKAYRNCWALLPAFSAWDRKKAFSVAEFLALLQAEGVQIQGVPAEDVYLLARADRTQRRLRTEIAKASRAIERIDLAEVLPVDHPPEAVHLEEIA